MDAQTEAINQAVNSAVNASIRSLWWWQLIGFTLSVIASVIVAYLVAYAKKKGENYATKEDFNELLRQVKETTKTTEEIKAEISGGLWVDQQRWQMRKDLYLGLLENLKKSCKGLGEVIEAEEGSFQGGEQERSIYVNRRLRIIKNASEEIQKAVDLSGILFLSDTALEVLRIYQNAEEHRLRALSEQPDLHGDVSAEATSWSSYLENQLEAANTAYDEIVKVAKEDLRI
jgi:hypothetical protein